MRQREFAAGLSYANRHVERPGFHNPVVYVEIEEGVYAEVVGVNISASTSLGLKEDNVILLQISDPEDDDDA